MQVFKYIAVVIGLLTATSCTDQDYALIIGTTETETIIEYVEVEPDTEIWIDSFTQVGAFEEIDILWVIDKSCSMLQHDAALIDGVEAMMNSLPTDVNWRLKMITAGGSSHITQPTTFPLTRGDTPTDALDMLNALPADGYERGFDAVKNYIMTDAYAQTWMRHDASLLVLFVSDEEEQSAMAVNDFIMWYENIRNGVYMASIVNVDTADSICTHKPYGNMIGARYIEATDYFSGNVIDICEDDWGTAVEEATNQIEPFEDYMLTHKPYEGTIVVFEDGIPFSHWYYNKLDNKIYFNVIPAEGSLIEIGYDVKEYNYITNHTADLGVNNSSASP